MTDFLVSTYRRMKNTRASHTHSVPSLSLTSLKDIYSDVTSLLRTCFFPNESIPLIALRSLNFLRQVTDLGFLVCGGMLVSCGEAAPLLDSDHHAAIARAFRCRAPISSL